MGHDEAADGAAEPPAALLPDAREGEPGEEHGDEAQQKPDPHNREAGR